MFDQQLQQVEGGSTQRDCPAADQSARLQRSQFKVTEARGLGRRAAGALSSNWARTFPLPCEPA